MMFLQSMQSAPPTLRASQYEVPIESISVSQTRPSLGYTSVQFTSCPATLDDVPAQEGHMYESVKCVQSTTRSEEDREQSGSEVVAHPQPTSPESDYELMESARYYREEINHGDSHREVAQYEERMINGEETNHEQGEMSHEGETRVATSVEVSKKWLTCGGATALMSLSTLSTLQVQGDDFSISDAPSTAHV